MAAPLPFSESELRLLQVLLKRKVRFMVVGLSADKAIKAKVDESFRLK